MNDKYNNVLKVKNIPSVSTSVSSCTNLLGTERLRGPTTSLALSRADVAARASALVRRRFACAGDALKKGKKLVICPSIAFTMIQCIYRHKIIDNSIIKYSKLKVLG